MQPLIEYNFLLAFYFQLVRGSHLKVNEFNHTERWNQTTAENFIDNNRILDHRINVWQQQKIS